MADDFLSVIEKAMKAKEPGGGTMSGRTSTDASKEATQPLSPGQPMPLVRGEDPDAETKNGDPIVRLK